MSAASAPPSACECETPPETPQVVTWDQFAERAALVGLLPLVVDAVARPGAPGTLRTCAAEAVALASSASHFCAFSAASAGAVEALGPLVRDPDARVSQWALRGLAGIAGASEALAYRVVSSGALGDVLAVLPRTTATAKLEACAAFLAGASRALLSAESVRAICAALGLLCRDPVDSVKAEALRALVAVVSPSDDRRTCAVLAGVVSRVPPILRRGGPLCAEALALVDVLLQVGPSCADWPTRYDCVYAEGIAHEAAAVVCHRAARQVTREALLATRCLARLLWKASPAAVAPVFSPQLAWSLAALWVDLVDAGDLDAAEDTSVAEACALAAAPSDDEAAECVLSCLSVARAVCWGMARQRSAQCMLHALSRALARGPALRSVLSQVARRPNGTQDP
eukprot:m51a1_g8173 hypothetical protein (398) ;mRNA; f:111045-112467